MTVTAPVTVVTPSTNAADGSVAATTRATLDDAGRLESPAGQAAMVLARRIDNASAETGSGLSSLVREHRTTLMEALKNSDQAADPLDELRLRRERKLGAG